MKAIKFLPLALAIATVGCAQQTKIERAAEDNKTSALKLKREAEDAANNNGLKSRTLVSRTNVPFVSTGSVDAEVAKQMPAQLTAHTDFSTAGANTLSAIAERITLETNIPVRLNSDVFSSSGGNSSTGTMPVAPVAMSGGVTVSGTGVQPAAAPTLQSNVDPTRLTLRPRYSGPLYAFLDQVGNQLGLGWRFNAGVVEFFRYETKRFEYRAPAGTIDMATQIGKSGSGSSGSTATQVTAGASFSTSNSMNRQGKYDPWTSIKDKVGVMLSSAGKAAYDPYTGSIVVTDTHMQVERIGRMITEENAVINQQVAVTARFVSIDVTDSAEYGFDWAAAFTTYANGIAQTTFNFTSPTSLVSAIAANGTYAVVAPPGDYYRGRFSGSNLAVQAIAGIGSNSAVRSETVLATNRRATTLAFTSQDTYLAKTTPATGGATGGGTGVPGLEPGIFTYGFMLSVLPTVFKDGSINMEITGNVTTSRGIDKVTTGSGATLQQIQTPKADTNDVSVAFSARSGQTIVVPLYEGRITNSDKRSLDENVPIVMSGSYSGKSQHSMLFLVVTPELKGVGL